MNLWSKQKNWSMLKVRFVHSFYGLVKAGLIFLYRAFFVLHLLEGYGDFSPQDSMLPWRHAILQSIIPYLVKYYAKNQANDRSG